MASKKTKTKPKTSPKKERKPVESKNSIDVASTKKTSADDLVLRQRGLTTKFKDVLAQAATLKEGEALEITLDKTDKKSVANSRNWLATLVRARITAPKGTAVVVRTTADAKLAIVCQKID